MSKTSGRISITLAGACGTSNGGKRFLPRLLLLLLQQLLLSLPLLSFCSIPLEPICMYAGGHLHKKARRRRVKCEVGNADGDGGF